MTEPHADATHVRPPSVEGDGAEPPDGGPARTVADGTVPYRTGPHRTYPVQAVGGPLPVAWREGTLTRATELETLSAWIMAGTPEPHADVLSGAIRVHLDAARDAARAEPLQPTRKIPRMFRRGSLLERAMSNLDAAEAQLLNFAPPDYLLGQMASLLRHVQCHLLAQDPRRLELERIAQQLSNVPSGTGSDAANGARISAAKSLAIRERIVRDHRGTIVTAVRGASSAALREQVRLRSFRNVLVVTTLVMTVLAITVAVVGFVDKTLIPLCFEPENGGTSVVVCPTAESDPFSTDATDPSQATDIDEVIASTARDRDLFVVEFVGLAAAAVAATVAIRNIRGTSERYGIPVALAVLKLPTGALTAFLGLLLMRGRFVPGLTALDTSAQILAWALVFGYAQQLFTRFVDRQGQVVLDSVRAASTPQAEPSP